MRFLFDCEDEICLPMAYRLVDDAKPFIEKVKRLDVNEKDAPKTKTGVLKKILENMMVKYPRETGQVLSKLWVLEDGENAPNTFKTLSTLFANEVAVDFFTSVMPTLLHVSKELSPLLK